MRRWSTILLVLGCAIVFASIEVLQGYLRARALGNNYALGTGIADSFSSWLVMAALTPIAFFASRRFRIGRGRLRNAWTHVVAALVFGGIGVTLVAALLALRKPDLTFLFLFVKTATFFLVYYFLLYWAVAGAIHAVDYSHEAQARQLALTRERLEVLRAKLNPHFLFNTLNAISTMALQRNHDGVAQSLGLVGDMLRATLDDSLPQEIPLARELELTDKYLALQRIRFGDRLRIDRSIAPDALDAHVPSMLLQPLVENAIVHGVAMKPGEGWVRIESNVAGDELRIAVSDSGSGFADASPSGNGIGLKNTRERLQTLYGGAHRFTIGSVAEGGASIAISIPLRRATA